MGQHQYRQLVALLPKTVPGSATFKQSVVNANNAQTSFTNVHNGGVRTGKWAVTVSSRKNTAGTQTDPTSVSLAGTALTKIHSGVNARMGASVWVSTTDITTDGTDNIVVSTATASDRCMTALYALDDVLAPGTVIDTASATGGTPSLNTDSVAGGVMIGVGGNRTPTAFTWSGLTEDSDDNVSGSIQYSSASGEFASAGTQSISATQGATEAIAIVVSIR